jgi:hypothetical protein
VSQAQLDENLALRARGDELMELLKNQISTTAAAHVQWKLYLEAQMATQLESFTQQNAAVQNEMGRLRAVLAAFDLQRRQAVEREEVAPAAPDVDSITEILKPYFTEATARAEQLKADCAKYWHAQQASFQAAVDRHVTTTTVVFSEHAARSAARDEAVEVRLRGLERALQAQDETILALRAAPRATAAVPAARQAEATPDSDREPGGVRSGRSTSRLCEDELPDRAFFGES